MNIDIRKSIINNFQGATIEDIENSITDSLKEREEITLPGLGVFFEILWSNSNDSLKNNILNTLQQNLKAN